MVSEARFDPIRSKLQKWFLYYKTEALLNILLRLLAFKTL